MIFVYTYGDYRVFKNFLQEFYLREHFGRSWDKDGQARYIPHADAFRGIDRGILLIWGPRQENTFQDEAEIHELAARYDIPVMTVPDLRRQRAQREHPEAFRR
jgi:hypothetical protein